MSPSKSPLMYERNEEEDEEEEFPPPPPPPPLDDSQLSVTSSSYMSTPLRGQTSPHHWDDQAIHSNVSVLSSSRTEDSEEDPKKRNKVVKLIFVCILFGGK